jgi:hypothetical protein
MRLSITVLAGLTLATSVLAQSIVVPASRAVFSGGGYTSYPLNRVNCRLQQCTRELRGTTATMQNMAFRRYWNYANTTNPKARTIELEIRMGPGTWNAFTNNFSNNWAGTPTLVIAKRKVNCPDWSIQPTKIPTKFDAILGAFDTKYVYDGKNDLIWEATTYSNTVTTTYPHDYARQGATSKGFGRYSLYGNVKNCNATGQTNIMYFNTYLRGQADGKCDFYHNVGRAPASTPIMMVIGGSKVDVPIGGFCANLFNDALMIAPGGTSDATGKYATQYLPFTWNASFAGAIAYTQGFANDTVASKVVGSRGRTIQMPFGIPDVKINLRRMYNSSNRTALTGSGPYNGGAIVKFN